MVEDDVTKLTLSIQGARPRECPTFIIQNPGWPRAISRKLRGISYSYKERTEFVSPRTIPGFLLRRNASIIEIPPVPPSYNSFIILMTRLARCLATHCSSPCHFFFLVPFYSLLYFLEIWFRIFSRRTSRYSFSCHVFIYAASYN